MSLLQALAASKVDADQDIFVEVTTLLVCSGMLASGFSASGRGARTTAVDAIRQKRETCEA